MPDKKSLISKLLQTEKVLEDQIKTLKLRSRRIRYAIYRNQHPKLRIGAGSYKDQYYERVPKKFNGTDDDYRRLVLNNERLGISGYQASAEDITEGAIACLDDDYSRYPLKKNDDGFYNICNIAKKGDPLCKLLERALRLSHYETQEKILEGIDAGKIIFQIISRRGLTEETYQKHIDMLKDRFQKHQ